MRRAAHKITRTMLYAVAKNSDGTTDLTVFEGANACAVSLNLKMAAQLARLLTPAQVKLRPGTKTYIPRDRATGEGGYTVYTPLNVLDRVLARVRRRALQSPRRGSR